MDFATKMIELQGLKKVRERIRDEGLNIKATKHDITPNNHEQSIGRKQGLQFAEEQTKSDFRKIAEQLQTIATHEANSTNHHGLTELYLKNLISAIHSALQEGDET